VGIAADEAWPDDLQIMHQIRENRFWHGEALVTLRFGVLGKQKQIHAAMGELDVATHG
jgi:hypothetical protein